LFALPFVFSLVFSPLIFSPHFPSPRAICQMGFFAALSRPPSCPRLLRMDFTSAFPFSAMRLRCWSRALFCFFRSPVLHAFLRWCFLPARSFPGGINICEEITLLFPSFPFAFHLANRWLRASALVFLLSFAVHIVALSIGQLDFGFGPLFFFASFPFWLVFFFSTPFSFLSKPRSQRLGRPSDPFFSPQPFPYIVVWFPLVPGVDPFFSAPDQDRFF